ncbi:MAG: hypothetical protein HC890_16395 [Chloroflexaceae bacterium]|nr:hypothetical protein [Chloroflexaceae bacterium]
MMKILHGTWIPQAIAEFAQAGGFYLWVETDTLQKRRAKTGEQVRHHPRQLFPQELVSFVTEKLGLSPTQQTASQHLASRYFLLPSTDSEPLPSPELSRYWETEVPAPTGWQYWAMDCYQLDAIIKQLSDIHFLCLYDTAEMQLGADLLFWYHYTQAFREIILKDHYIPALKYRELSPAAVKRSKKPTAELTHAIYPGWEIISDTYQTLLHLYSEAMPILCGAGVETPGEFLEYYDSLTLLQQFSECLLQEIVTATPIPAVFARKLEGSELLTSTLQANLFSPWTGSASLEEYQKWLAWKQKLLESHQDNTFYLCFQLQEAAGNYPDDWWLRF